MEDKEYNKINFMDDVSEIYAKFPMAILNEQANQMAGEWQNLSMKYVYKMQSKIDTLEQELSKANDKLKKIEEYIEPFIIDDELDHDCCEEEKHYVAMELLEIIKEEKKESDK